MNYLIHVEKMMLAILLMVCGASVSASAGVTESGMMIADAPVAFMRGAAMGLLPNIDCNGTCSKYRANKTAAAQDALQILGDYGMNTVRLRLFIFPYPNNSYAGLPSVMKMAKRAKAAGLQLSLDIFYTQWFWGTSYEYQRQTPEQWKNLSFSELLEATYNYTHESVASLVKQGTPPQTVQIGNEIDCGLMFNWPGQPCSRGGDVCGSCKNNWGNLAALIKAGSTAVYAASPGSKVIIQLGASHDLAEGGDYIKEFYSSISAHGAPYDAFGLSFYQIWGAHNISNLCAIGKAAKALPDKKIYVIETGYPYKYDGHFEPGKVVTPQFPVTPEGQAGWLRAMTYTVEHGLWGRGAGVSWWGTEYANPCSHDECASFWDDDFIALPVLTTGAFGPTEKNNPPPKGLICPPLKL